MRRRGSRLLNCNAALRPATPCSLSMCVNLRNSLHLRVICQAPSTCGWLIYQAGPENLPPGDNRLWWFVKPIVDPPGQQRSYLPLASGMSPFFVVEQTSGIDKGWLSNSVGLTGPVQHRPVHQPRLQAAPPSTQNLAQCGWLSDTAPLAPARLGPRSQSGS